MVSVALKCTPHLHFDPSLGGGVTPERPWATLMKRRVLLPDFQRSAEAIPHLVARPEHSSSFCFHSLHSIVQDNVTQLVGNTPMCYLNKVTEGCVGEIAAKLEIVRAGDRRPPPPSPLHLSPTPSGGRLHNPN